MKSAKSIVAVKKKKTLINLIESIYIHSKNVGKLTSNFDIVFNENIKKMVSTVT